MAKRRARKRRKTSRKRRRGFPWLKITAVLFVLIAGYVAWLDYRVTSEFDGKRWSLPARVYSRPLELYVGQSLTAAQFQAELRALGYRESASLRPGEYTRQGSRFRVSTRVFRHPDGEEPARSLALSFSGNSVQSLTDLQTGKSAGIARLDPVLVGSFYPAHREDRVLLQLEDVPIALTDALIAIEDRGFYRHAGVSPLGILRALVVNLRSGRVVQGGSTLTQQLVKNYFLDSRRTLTRKVNEAIMALLLELHYEKDEILEAYLNEVYLGQDGGRAIHGFGLASYFYFDRPLAELTLDQYALLVGLVKGPSYYNPRRHPERSRERRNLVIDVMIELGLVDAGAAEKAKRRGLGVARGERTAINAFPAFLDLVRRQLRRDYRDEDITSEGLRIFTTLDPQQQWQLESAVTNRLDRLERGGGIEKDLLQAAGIVTTVDSGEVLALVGGRQPGFAGFNRALDAGRQVGSLLKPAVYLAALEQPQRWTLATLLDDSPLTWTAPNGDTWTPANYDKEHHGHVPLYQALAHSYNVATARLGLTLGLDRVIATLKRLGVERRLNPYPSLLLGAVEMTPLQVTELYQVFASGGFRVPLRAIRGVLSAEDEPLKQYPLDVRAVVEPGPTALIAAAMGFVAREGTARAIYQVLPENLPVAGKTGTTDGLRDSWFAGFAGNRLGVVWIGNDENRPTGLTGSSGALRVWRDFFAASTSGRAERPLAGSIEFHYIDPASGLLGDGGCPGVVELPFIAGSAPVATAPCATGGSTPAPVKWFRELFD